MNGEDEVGVNLPVRWVMQQIAAKNGMELPDLSDEEILEVAEEALYRFSTVTPAAEPLMGIVDDVIAKRAEGGVADPVSDLDALLVIGSEGRAKSGLIPGPDRPLTCCTPERYIGPSGQRVRHSWTCKLRGQPLEQQVMDSAVAEIAKFSPKRNGSYHPACIAAWNEGAEACANCTYRLCTDDDCTEHDVCIAERGWEVYFGA